MTDGLTRGSGLLSSPPGPAHPRVIIRAVPARAPIHGHLRRSFPDAEWLIDQDKIGAMENALAAWRLAGDDPTLQVEDDAKVVEDFWPRALEVIEQHPESVVQFFSRRREDLTVGSRWDSSFVAALCYYLPGGYGPMIADYYPDWPDRLKHPDFLDYTVRDWLNSRKESYWIEVPNLAQHQPVPSTLGPRSKYRQSLTFPG